MDENEIDYGKPVCRCCNGSGEHEYRPYINASPYDTTAECTRCDGTGHSWFDGHSNSCSAYRELANRAWS